MNKRYTKSFKIQAVEKALNRPAESSLKEVAESLGVGYSALGKWIVQSREQVFEMGFIDKTGIMTKEKRPQDWSLEERLNMVITCASLGGEAISELCREQGLYPHHIKQWKLDFTHGNAANSKATSRSEVKGLKHENKALKKELNRKDKALAETAALLVLQKKVNAIWGSGEDDSQ